MNLDDTNGFIPLVRCICGRVMPVLGGPVMCKCGVTLTTRMKRGEVQPWANTPDGYDLATRKHNKPTIAGWKDALK